jgi:hypothetical protein
MEGTRQAGSTQGRVNVGQPQETPLHETSESHDAVRVTLHPQAVACINHHLQAAIESTNGFV